MAAAALQRSGMVSAVGSHASAKLLGTEKGKSMAAIVLLGEEANILVRCARGMIWQDWMVSTPLTK